MKRILNLILLIGLTGLFFQCDNVKGTLIEGKVTGAGNLQVFLDDVVIGQAATVLKKEDIGSGGSFRMSFPEGLPAGIYNLRIGAKRINLVFDGNQKRVTIKGDLATLQDYAVTIEGSPSSQALATVLNGAISKKLTVDDVISYVDTTKNALLGAYIAYRALGAAGPYLPIQRKALEKLAAADPESPNLQPYANFIEAVQTQYAEQQSRNLIQIGAPAPDIALPSPSGKTYRLSDLKGKVVLLDFWASWCGPCRRENPNVVAIYNKYKDKGFTIFSVSLDGINDNDRSQINPSQLPTFLDRGRQEWVNAIQADNLSWPYHVSDLKQWSAGPAEVYGVRGIPRAFMIDRKGNIVSTEVRGAANLEAELLKYL
jgi:thiol-disulfide isomerase/thioredoxin